MCLDKDKCDHRQKKAAIWLKPKQSEFVTHTHYPQRVTDTRYDLYDDIQLLQWSSLCCLLNLKLAYFLVSRAVFFSLKQRVAVLLLLLEG